MVHDESPKTHETYRTICPGIKGSQLPDLPLNHIIAHNKTPIFHRPAQFDDLSALLQIILRQADQQAPLYLHICQQLMLSVLKLTEQMIANTAPKTTSSKMNCAHRSKPTSTPIISRIWPSSSWENSFSSVPTTSRMSSNSTPVTRSSSIFCAAESEKRRIVSLTPRTALPRLPAKSALKIRLIFPVFSPNTLACHPNFTANSARSPTSGQESLTKNGHFLWHAPDPARLSNLARAFRPALCNAQKSIVFAGTLYYNRLVA